jgi:phosphatidylglycerol:prolipoprotein diacylglycerol transferase
MAPTLSLGPFVLYTYTVLIDIGLLGALVWLWFRAGAHGREARRWLDAGLCAAAGALAGGRIAFAIANWLYYRTHLTDIFNLWEGGYAWPGALLGGVLGLLLYCRFRREPLLILLDELALPALGLAALGWMGCAAAGCAAGAPVPPGSLPFAVNWPDMYGVVLPRWPTQIMGAAFSLIALGYLFSQRDRPWPRGFRFAVALTLLAFIALMISFVRGDDMPLVNGWRLDVIANAAMTALGVIALVAAWATEPAKAKTLTTEYTESTENVKNSP